MMPTAPPPTNNNSNVLPETFVPSVNEVIIGRGKRIAEHPGNKRLHAIVRNFVKEYAAAPTKRQKSTLLTKVVLLIRGNSVPYQAGFVKQDTLQGRWLIVEDSAARITVAQAFRDALHIHYKSSKQFKQQKRQVKNSGGRGSTKSVTAVRDLSSSCGGATTMQPLNSLREVACIGTSSSNNSSTGLLLQTLDTFRSSVPQVVADVQQEDVLASGSSSSCGGDKSSTGLLSSLLSVLEASVDMTVDPFEPTPIPEHNNSTFEGSSSRPVGVFERLSEAQSLIAPFCTTDNDVFTTNSAPVVPHDIFQEEEARLEKLSSEMMTFDMSLGTGEPWDEQQVAV